MPRSVKLKEKRGFNPEAELVEKYQYLISKISAQFKEVTEPRETLEEVGYIGLLNAANLYDKNIHMMNFKTYAQILITEEMHQYLMNRNRKVDCPDWLVNLNNKIDKFVIEYREKHHKFPKVSEIASHLNINSFGLQEVLKARDSLRENHFSGKTDWQIDLSQIQPNLGKIKSQSYQSFKLPIEDLIVLRRAFRKLKKLQEGIVYYLFVMDLGQTKLARMLGISNQKASQIKKEVLNNLQ